MTKNELETTLASLKERLKKVYDLQGAAAVLSWDQATYMPPAGAPARGRQIALLGRLAQEELIDPEIGRLLDRLDRLTADLSPEDDRVALLRITRREYEQAVRIPPELLGRFYTHSSETYQVWTKARAENDFEAVRPYLEKTLAISREVAECFPGYEHIADPLIDFSDFGMKAADIRALFRDLRARLVPLVERITAQEEADDRCLHRYFPESEQQAFARDLAGQFGYDFQRGRIDKTFHPFMTKFSPGDVRITTRVDEHNLAENLFSVLHETGHALYEMGIDAAYEGTPLDNGTSAGVHESQSRLWENFVGRSRAFWEFQFPHLQAVFSEQLGNVSLAQFNRAINKVGRSLVRTDADEVTYNLHVMIRFDLELEMLEGKLAVKDLPDAWHARYEGDLGLSAPDDVDGCLQDVHWYDGYIGGAFQGYTLGNVLSATFFEAAVQADPAIQDEIRAGRYGRLHDWLRENIYRHGSKFTADELVERLTGGPLGIEPYIDYLHRKFGELYDLGDLDTEI